MNNKDIIRVKDIMHQNYLLIDGLTNAQDAIGEMRTNNKEILVVDKRHDDDEYGLVLPSYIAKHILSNNRSPERVSVYEVMTKPILCVQANMNIRYCARLLDHCHLENALVVNSENHVIGMIDYSSLVLKGMTNNNI